MGRLGGAVQRTVTMWVVPRDAWGNAVDDVAGLEVTGLVQYPPPDPTVVVCTVSLEATAEHRRAWRVRFVAQIPGAPRAAVRMGGQHVHRSPLPLQIVARLAGPADPALSVARGAGAELATAGAPAEFVVHAVGAAGLPLAEGGERFHAEIARRGAAPAVRAAGIDRGDGTYGLECAPPSPPPPPY